MSKSGDAFRSTATWIAALFVSTMFVAAATSTVTML